jgi:hypothetical protein
MLMDFAALYIPSEYDETVTSIFAFGIAIFFVAVPAVLTHVSRLAHFRVVATISSLFTWLAVSNLIDEVVGKGCTPATIAEYSFAVFSVICAIGEYNKIRVIDILKAVIHFTKTKLILWKKLFLNSWEKTRK